MRARQNRAIRVQRLTDRKLNFLLATLFAGVAALLFATFASAQAPDAAADQLLQQADQALQKQDYNIAAQALEAYLAKNPKDFRAEFNLAYAYSLTGRRAEAISRYKNVLSREPGLDSAHLNLGILLVQEGHPEEAEGHLRAALKQQPENYTGNFYLAEALAALKRLPEASEAYERALKLKPDDARIHLGYGKLLQESNPSAAEEHLRRAIQIDPSMEAARLDLAVLLEAGAARNPGALSEAAEIYRQLLDKHPERRDLRVHLGEISVAQKQFVAAAGYFEAARAAGEGSLPLAKKLLQTYLSMLNAGKPPGEPGSTLMPPMGATEASNREKLQERLQNPESGKSDAAKTGDKIDTEKTRDKAAALVREVLIRESGDVEMHLLYGRLRMERKDYQGAAEEFLKAIDLQPKSAENFTNLAAALYLMGNIEATLQTLAKVSELQKDTAGIYFLRAICLDKLHRLKPALDNYQRFLAVDEGKNPDQEFQARQRSRILTLDIKKGIGGGK